MTTASDFYGHRYEPDVLPAFVIASDKLCFHVATHRLIDMPALVARMDAAGWTQGENEVAAADDWLLANTGIADHSTPAPVEAPITATADLGAGTITVGGGPSDSAATLTVTYRLDGDESDRTVEQEIAEGDTAEDVASALAGQFSDDTTATATGAVVTLTPAAEGSFTALSAAVA